MLKSTATIFATASDDGRIVVSPMSDSMPPQSSILLYQTEDGRTRVQCRFEDKTVWLTQKLIGELFQKDVRTINEHIQNIVAEGELVPDSVVRKFRITAADGKNYDTQHYNLDMVLAVGYRVRSQRGTEFRQWATARLTEYLVKGFTMDHERLKNPPGPGQTDYFDELLERVRDIRSSERRFYQKVIDIYATSIDYSPNAETTQRFFATVQNKMHFAAHGHTAAEVIHERTDASKPLMGLQTTRPGKVIRRSDVAVAKNYLDAEELHTLNLIVNLYVEFAELQALEKKPMTMARWVEKLDEFLKISGRELLDHAGHVSAETARLKAEQEYDAYRKSVDREPRAVDAHFEAAARQVKSLPRPRATRATKKTP